MISVFAAFEKFRCNLEITGLQESVVAARQKKVRAAVSRGLTLRESFLTGSYRRGTLIGPMRDADVDLVVVLDRSYRNRGPRAVLDLQRHLEYLLSGRVRVKDSGCPWGDVTVCGCFAMSATAS